MTPLSAAILLCSAARAGEDLSPRVDQQRLVSDLRALTGHDAVDIGDGPMSIASRNIHHPDHAVAAAWVTGAFEDIDGLSVWTEPFEDRGEGGLANIVAELPGADPGLPILVVGAHLDSIASASDGWRAGSDPAPGADDDASGVSAALEVARLLAARPDGYARTVRFVIFDDEEYGLVGSFEHVDRAVSDGVEVALAVVMDPVGYNPGGANYLWFSYDARFEAEALALEATALEIDATVRAEAVDQVLFGGDARSDHYPFWEAGMPALHLASYPQPEQYHTVDDDLDVVDPVFLAAVSGLVASHVATLAEPVAAVDTGGEDVVEDEACGCATRGGPVAWWLPVGVVALAFRRRR